MKLTPDNVREVFNKCLFDPFSPHNEKDCSIINIQGVQIKVNFDEKIINIERPYIENLIDQLPAEFKSGTGDGWSFLNACNDATGNQWADLHYSIDQLVCLGMAIGKIKFLLPRGFWDNFPGGVPYFSIS